MKKLKTNLVAIFIASLLVGCGGGGGFGGNAPDPTVGITGENADDAAEEVMRSASLVQGALFGVGGIVFAVGESNDAGAGGDIRLVDIVSRVASAHLGSPEGSVSIAADPLDLCDGGDADISGTEDAPIIDFTDCFIFFDVVLNGRMAIGGDSFIIDEGDFFLDLEFVDFAFGDEELIFSFDGDMQFSGNFNELDQQLIIEGRQLALVTPDSDDILFDFFYDFITFDEGDYLLDMSGTLDSVTLGGIVDFETTTPFAGFEGFPGSGILLITGLTSSTRVEAQDDETNVLIFVDPEGDGTFEEPFLRMWTEITDDFFIIF